MNDISHIRRRIRSRKYGRYQKPERNHFFHFMYRGMMLLMSAGVIALALAINSKVGLIELPKELMNIDFSKVSTWLPFEDWFSLKDETVAAYPSYHLLKDDMYANGTNSAYSLNDGVVLHVQKEKDNTYSITVRHDNNVVATYGNLNSTDIKQDERIRKGDTLGSFQESVRITFVKDEKKITLEQAQA